MFSPGPVEMLVVVLIIILLFGAKRIPDLAKSVGQGIKEFKQGIKETEEPTESEKR